MKSLVESIHESLSDDQKFKQAMAMMKAYDAERKKTGAHGPKWRCRLCDDKDIEKLESAVKSVGLTPGQLRIADNAFYGFDLNGAPEKKLNALIDELGLVTVSDKDEKKYRKTLDGVHDYVKKINDDYGIILSTYDDSAEADITIVTRMARNADWDIINNLG